MHDTRDESHAQDVLDEPGDTWVVTQACVIRIHRKPRHSLFKPEDEESLPVPVQYLDIMRTTETDLLDESESKIDDYWTEAGTRSLSDAWTGRTMFYLRMPIPPQGSKWVRGRLVKIKKNTSRPDNILPEVWRLLSPKTEEAGNNKEN